MCQRLSFIRVLGGEKFLQPGMLASGTMVAVESSWRGIEKHVRFPFIVGTMVEMLTLFRDYCF